MNKGQSIPIQWRLLMGLVLVFCLVFEGGHPQAQAKAQDTLTITEAISLALAKNRALQRSQIELESQHWKETMFMAKHLPELSLGVEHIFSQQPELHSVPTSGEAPTMLHTDLRWMVYDGMKTLNQLSAAEVATESLRARASRERREIVQQTRLRFYQVIGSQFLLEVAAQNISTLQEHLRLIESHSQNGAASRFDILRVEVKLEEARLEKAQTEEALLLARNDFFQTLGQTDSGEILRGQFREIWQNLQLNELTLDLTKNLENREQRLRVNELHLTQKALRGSWWPELAFVASRSWEQKQNYSWQGHYDNEATFGLQVKWSLYGGGADQAAQNIALNEEKKAQSILSDLELRQEMDFGFWKKKLQTQLIQLGVISTAIKKAEENVRLAQLGLNEGVRTNADVLDAILDQNRTKARLIRSQIDMIDSLGQLEKVMGDSVVNTGSKD